MKINRLWAINLALLIFFFLLFTLKGLYILDPDFGWHYQMGEVILASGIPKTDPFSYSMPSFPFIDHEWLTNMLLFPTFNLVGQTGLAVIYGWLTTLALLIVSRGKNPKFLLPLTLLTGLILLPFVGIRPQIETWVLFSLLISVIFSQKWNFYKFFLPLLFGLWTNVHGGFSAGIAVLIFSVLLRSIENKKLLINDALLSVVCLLSTFLNPYGPRIWVEVFSQLTDSSLKSSVQEWLPALLRIDPSLLIYLALSLAFVIRSFWQISLVRTGTYLAVLLAALSSQRHLPLWILVSLPVTYQTLELFYQELSMVKFGLSRLKTITQIFLVCLTGLLIVESYLYVQSVTATKENQVFPVQAVAYLKAHPFSGNLFNYYDWGGYLIWQYPQKKVFIDGRMPSWRRDWAPNNESKWAFDDYRKIYSDEIDWQKLFQRYQITEVLLPKEKPATSDSSVIYYLTNSIESVFPQVESHKKDLYQRLKEAHWRVIYQDDLAVIYQSPNF